MGQRGMNTLWLGHKVTLYLRPNDDWFGIRS